MANVSEKEFLKLAKKGNLIPVFTEIQGDCETPVSAFKKLAEKSKYSFLLESVEGAEKVARFSFLARDPELIFQSKNNNAKITTFKNGKSKTVTKKVTDTPLSFLREILAPFKFVNLPQLPRFSGGLVGYLGYDIVRFFEKLPKKAKDDLKVPDSILMLAKEILIFDHINHKIKVLINIDLRNKKTISAQKKAYKDGLKSIEKTILALNQPLLIPKSNTGRKATSSLQLNVKSNFTEAQFKDIVTKAKKKIQAGEIIQVVLSQRLSVKLKTKPFEVYRSLRALNPSPYMFYLNFDKIQLVGSSPELLVRSEEGVVETRPIAGTRPRGKDDAEDQRNAKDLLNDPKEIAEHIMLVDLGRNDLGRVCKQGTVEVDEFMNVEFYSHVMHIVSNVIGKLQKSYDGYDVLKAAFPAGTVSGAPKIRAMEIIEELEKTTRGPYAGCIGYFSFTGNLDSCITIRTIVVKDSVAFVQAGAGIVADSVAKKEYQETLNKAKAQIRAIQLAHKK